MDKFIIYFCGYGLALCANGILTINTRYDDTTINNSLSLKNGSIFMGPSHNMITGLTGSAVYDRKTRNLTVPEIRLMLYRGSIRLHDGVVRLSNHSNTPLAYTLPYVIEDCFVGTPKISAIINGNLILETKPDGSPLISGGIRIDKGCMNTNILSSPFSYDASGVTGTQGNTLLPQVQFNCTITNEQAIKVRTGSLNADVCLDLALQGTTEHPDITGSIELGHGTLNLPSAALRITHGSVHFIAGQPYDPRIEITARGMIKRYSVTLGLSGTPQEPHIRLESMPMLSEEQIGSLLLAGTEDASLNIVVPSLVTQNLKALLFGNAAQRMATHRKWYHRLLKPLRHINLLPTFTDQTGRDGFKAAIEINVNDRLNARIEKNFSSTEDTAWEIDYRLTDDLSTKIIRDEHGDLGGEAEMRWKF